MSNNNETNAFVKNVHLKGFKSIKDLEVRLNNGLNIIIGPNGSGKTNFVEFLKYALLTVSKESFKTPYTSQITFQTSNGDFILEEILDNKLRQKEGALDFSSIRTSLTEINNNTIREIEDGQLYWYLRKHNKDLLLFCLYLSFSYKCEFNETFMFTELGEINVDKDTSLFGTLPNIFETKIHELDDFPFLEGDKVEELFSTIQDYLIINKEIINNLQQYSPIKSIRVSESLKISKIEYGVKLEYLMLEFYVNNTWLKWNQLSDGTQRIFEIIYRISNNGSQLILLEEPENGVHPDQLRLLLDFLIEQSKHKQIILTTHAPEVLNVLYEDELDRIIVTRFDEKTGTQMHHLSEKQKKKGKAYMKNVGYLSMFWSNSSLEKYVPEEYE